MVMLGTKWLAVDAVERGRRREGGGIELTRPSHLGRKQFSAGA